jgi:hypothetical protein
MIETADRKGDPRSAQEALMKNRIHTRLAAALAAAATVVALAIPGAASAYTDPPVVAGAHSTSVGQAPAAVQPSRTSNSDGFDWADATLGAGVSLGFVALIGAGVAVTRKRAAPSPSHG